MSKGLRVDGIFVISKELIDRLPKLEIIACFGVGYDGIDLRQCQERDIVVTRIHQMC